ncbi:hypothetical protein AAHB50_28880 [Bacillus toyonensis]
MKPVLVANIHVLRGQAFLCAYLYDGNYVIARILAPATEMPLTKKMREVVWANCDDLPPFDVWTSDDSIYLACLTASDITGHFKTQEETSETLRGFEDEKIQAALIDVYELKDPNEITQTKQLPKWRTVLISWMRKLLEKLEGKRKMFKWKLYEEYKEQDKKALELQERYIQKVKDAKEGVTSAVVAYEDILKKEFAGESVATQKKKALSDIDKARTAIQVAEEEAKQAHDYAAAELQGVLVGQN